MDMTLIAELNSSMTANFLKTAPLRLLFGCEITPVSMQLM
jgi:hypothetical protein